MHVEFADGEAGYQEARLLLRLVRHALENDPTESAAIQLFEALRHACEQHLARPEFEPLRVAEESNDVDDAERSSWWRGLLGPSRRELALSAQRSAALERAERAERSAFEAVAETARVARERDELAARLAEQRAQSEGVAKGGQAGNPRAGN